MAKKNEPGAKDSAGPREAVRGAVESTFQRAAGGASKAQELLEDISASVRALRDANLVETLESLREEVQALAKRVAALESQAAKPTPKKKAAATRSRSSAAKTKSGS